MGGREGGAAVGAGLGRDMHVSDSRLALGRDGFGFPGLEMIENEGGKKLKRRELVPLATTRG